MKITIAVVLALTLVPLTEAQAPTPSRACVQTAVLELDCGQVRASVPDVTCVDLVAGPTPHYVGRGCWVRCFGLLEAWNWTEPYETHARLSCSARSPEGSDAWALCTAGVGLSSGPTSAPLLPVSFPLMCNTFGTGYLSIGIGECRTFFESVSTTAWTATTPIVGGDRLAPLDHESVGSTECA